MTENAGDSVFGLIAAHSGEMRHWSYNTVWWEPSCSLLTDAGQWRRLGRPEGLEIATLAMTCG